MTKKFEYSAILVRGPQNFVFAGFPFDSVKEFGTRKAVPVKVSFDGKKYEMNLLPRGKGKHWLQLRKEIRKEIGKDEGDTISIILEKNDSPKSVKVPDYLQWLLEDDPMMMKSFNNLSYSIKKFWIGYIEETRNNETRVERINRFFEYIHRNYSG